MVLTFDCNSGQGPHLHLYKSELLVTPIPTALDFGESAPFYAHYPSYGCATKKILNCPNSLGMMIDGQDCMMRMFLGLGPIHRGAQEN